MWIFLFYKFDSRLICFMLFLFVLFGGVVLLHVCFHLVCCVPANAACIYLKGSRHICVFVILTILWVMYYFGLLARLFASLFLFLGWLVGCLVGWSIGWAVWFDLFCFVSFRLFGLLCLVHPRTLLCLPMSAVTLANFCWPFLVLWSWFQWWWGSKARFQFAPMSEYVCQSSPGRPRNDLRRPRVAQDVV